ncbi:GAF domain-containing protein, partial [Archangium sp.]|uniref:GAF domain-containing protein n=1 Tax=Archangium sp. TaxID=1872627 RepID=UPI002ED7FFCE
LERLCELIVPRLGTACHVRLLSEDGLWLNAVASAHADPEVRALIERLNAAPQRADEGLPAQVLRTGRAALVTPEELTLLQRQIPAEVRPPLPPFASLHLLLLPLRARQRPLGLIAIHRCMGEPSFEKGEHLLLQELVDRAGLALDLARAYEAERRARHAAEVAAERLTRLQRVTEALSEAVTPADVTRVIVEEMVTALGADRVVAASPVPGDAGQLEVVGQHGLSPEALARLPHFSPTAPLPIAVAYRTGEPVWLESMEAISASFPQTLLSRPGVTQAVVALPLRARGRTLGSIGFGFDTRRAFGPDERCLLVELARQSAQALERAWLYESAQQARTRAERVAARTARLQTLNTALSQVLLSPRVAEVVIDQGVAAVGAEMGGLWLVDESGTQARLLRGVGLTPKVASSLATLPLAHSMPLTDAIRREQPVWLESPEEVARHYPRTEKRVSELVPSAPPFSMACLPLLVDGRSLGGLVFGFTGTHRFDDDERVFLTLLAHHAAQALERARLFSQERSAREALRDAHHTLEAIIQSSPTAIMAMELDRTVRLWNPAAERIFGWKGEEVLGRPSPIVPEEKQEELHDTLVRVARGESILGLETHRQRRDGSRIDVSMWITSVRPAEDRRLCLSVVADITERKRAEQALRFLAEASAVLASSLEFEVTLERVAHLAVPTYAEGCYVYLLGEGGAVSCVATARAGDQPELPRELGPLAPGASAVSRVIGSGQPELCVDRSGLPPPLAGRSTLPCELAARAYVCVPLVVREQTIGALSFVSSRHSYDAQDLTLAQELARRAALAIDNARLYREAR